MKKIRVLMALLCLSSAVDWAGASPTISYHDSSAVTAFSSSLAAPSRASSHSITVVCQPTAGGTVTLSQSEAVENDVITATVNVNSGYALKSIVATFVDEANNSAEIRDFSFDETTGIATFIMPDGNVTLTVAFDKVYQITVNRFEETGGEINIAQSAAAGETVEFTALPNAGYYLTGLIIDNNRYWNSPTRIKIDSSNKATGNYSFVMPSRDITIDAIFDLAPYTITPICQPADGGSIDIDATSFLCEDLNFTVTPNSGYMLSSLKAVYAVKDGKTAELKYDKVNDNEYHIMMEASDVTITAEFVPSEPHTITTVCTPEDKGTLTLDKTTAVPNEVVTITPQGSDGYGLSRITATYLDDNNEIVNLEMKRKYISSGNYGYTFVMPVHDVTVTAEFSKLYSLNVERNPARTGYFYVYVNPINNTIKNVYDNKIYDYNDKDRKNIQSVQIPAGQRVRINISSQENPPYVLREATLTNGTTGNVETLTDENVYLLSSSSEFYFTMPEANATVNAYYETPKDLYLLGPANGNDEWHTTGPKFDYCKNGAGYYSIRAYFKGYPAAEDEQPGKGYLLLSTAVNDNDDWNAIKDNLITATSDMYPIKLKEHQDHYYNYEVADLSDDINYDGHLDGRFMIPPGIYTIKVSLDLKHIRFEKDSIYTHIYCDQGNMPIGSKVHLSSSKSGSVNPWFNLILAINPNEQEHIIRYELTDSEGLRTGNSLDDDVRLRVTGMATGSIQESCGYLICEDDVAVMAFEQGYPPLAYALHPFSWEITEGSNVILGDELIATWGAKNILWAKDQGQRSLWYDAKNDESVDYIRQVSKMQKRDWDQSNWIMLDFAPLFPDWETNEETYMRMHNTIASYLDHKIEARSIKGTFTNHKRRISTEGDGFLAKPAPVIMLSELPTVVEQDNDVTLGYPGFADDPTEKAGKFYADPTQYMYNHYNPVSFTFNESGKSYYHEPGENNLVDYDSSSDPISFYFVPPKDQEVAHVWAVWKGKMRVYDQNETRMVVRDVFETYQPGIDKNGNYVNVYDLQGSFQILSWDYNRLPSIDANQTPRYGRPDQELQLDSAYLFHIAILKDQPFTMMLSSPARDGVKASEVNPYGFYRIYPLDMTRPSDAITGEDEVIDNSNLSTMIEHVRYYNIMGHVSDKPFEGINIVVTTYSDGHTTSRKLVNPTR